MLTSPLSTFRSSLAGLASTRTSSAPSHSVVPPCSTSTLPSHVSTTRPASWNAPTKTVSPDWGRVFPSWGRAAKQSSTLPPLASASRKAASEAGRPSTRVSSAPYSLDNPARSAALPSATPASRRWESTISPSDSSHRGTTTDTSPPVPPSRGAERRGTEPPSRAREVATATAHRARPASCSPRTTSTSSESFRAPPSLASNSASHGAAGSWGVQCTPRSAALPNCRVIFAAPTERRRPRRWCCISSGVCRGGWVGVGKDRSGGVRSGSPRLRVAEDPRRVSASEIPHVESDFFRPLDHTTVSTSKDTLRPCTLATHTTTSPATAAASPSPPSCEDSGDLPHQSSYALV
eukprot:Hpha_TRINITY_DN3742_c0_g1::TRINITY_DN3742_c0_g1_i1::g.23905::m.23905